MHMPSFESKLPFHFFKFSQGHKLSYIKLAIKTSISLLTPQACMTVILQVYIIQFCKCNAYDCSCQSNHNKLSTRQHLKAKSTKK